MRHEPVTASAPRPGGLPGGMPCPQRKDRPPIFPRTLRANRKGGLSSALIVVGVLALFGFIFSLELSRAIGTPVDTPLLEIGIAMIIAGGVGWVLYQKFMNDVF